MVSTVMVCNNSSKIIYIEVNGLCCHEMSLNSASIFQDFIPGKDSPATETDETILQDSTFDRCPENGGLPSFLPGVTAPLRNSTFTSSYLSSGGGAAVGSSTRPATNPSGTSLALGK